MPCTGANKSLYQLLFCSSASIHELQERHDGNTHEAQSFTLGVISSKTIVNGCYTYA